MLVVARKMSSAAMALLTTWMPSDTASAGWFVASDAVTRSPVANACSVSASAALFSED